MTNSAKPHGLHAQVQRAASRLAAEGRIARHVKTQPVQEFQRAPNDIMIKRVANGVVRMKEDALAIARRRDRGATYKGSDVRWFCFAPGRPGRPGR